MMPEPAPVVCFKCRRPVGFIRDEFAEGGWRPVCLCDFNGAR